MATRRPIVLVSGVQAEMPRGDVIDTGLNVTLQPNPSGLYFTGDNKLGFDGRSDSVSFTQIGTGADVRTVSDKLKDVVSVLDFIPETEHAAIRNKTTTYDASASIGEAVLAAAGKSLYFPAGLYLVSFSAGQTIIACQSNSDYFGDGSSSVIKIKDGSDATAAGLFINNITPIWVSNVNNVTVRNLSIDGNKSNITHPSEAPPGVYVINGSYDVLIDGVKVVNPGGDGIIVGSAGAVAVGGYRVTITNCFVSSPGRSCYVVTEGRDIIISNNQGIDASNSYVDLETDVAGTIITRVLVTNNIFKTTSGVQATGVGCTGGGDQSDIVISNNIFNSVTLGASIGGPTNTNITFSFNQISGVYSTGNRYLIEAINGLTKGKIIGNVVSITSPSASGGFWLRDCKDVLVSSNVISGVGYGHGILVDSPTSGYNVTVSDNTLRLFSAGVSSGINLNALNSKLENNTIEFDGLDVSGIVTGSSSCLLKNNTITNTSRLGQGIYTFGANVSVIGNTITGFLRGLYLINSTDILAADNLISDSEYGIYVLNMVRATIDSNRVSSCQKEGVYFTNGSYAIFTNNTVTNNSQLSAGTYYGVFVGQSHFFASGNTITDTQTPKTQAYAFRGVGGTTNQSFLNNMLAGNLTGAFSNLPGTAGSYYPNIAGSFATDMASFNEL